MFLFAGLVLLFHFGSVRQQKANVTKTVQNWKSIYHLDDSVAEQIRQIELEYHGNGSPLSLSVNQDRATRYQHHEAISKLMSPENGARFMRAMEKEADKH